MRASEMNDWNMMRVFARALRLGDAIEVTVGQHTVGYVVDSLDLTPGGLVLVGFKEGARLIFEADAVIDVMRQRAGYPS